MRISDQPTLFDRGLSAIDPVHGIPAEAVDIAAVYSCAESGKTSHVRLFMTTDEAMRFCSDDRTKGSAHGNGWIMMWTRLGRLVTVLGGDPTIRVEDDGRFAPLCDELGITPIAPTDPRVSRWTKLAGR